MIEGTNIKRLDPFCVTKFQRKHQNSIDIMGVILDDDYINDMKTPLLNIRLSNNTIFISSQYFDLLDLSAYLSKSKMHLYIDHNSTNWCCELYSTKKIEDIQFKLSH